MPPEGQQLKSDYFMSRQLGPALRSTTSGTSEVVDFFHGVADERAQAVELFGRRFEEQFVVDLQDHAGAEFLRGELAVRWRSWRA